MKETFILSAFLALLVGLAACGPRETDTAIPPTEPTEPTATEPVTEPTTDPYAIATAETTSMGAFVAVSDQDFGHGVVMVKKVNTNVDGWIVIHTEADGKPGLVIGFAQVPAGESSDVAVTIDASKAIPKLFAMLHVDEGTKGTYEFPGADVPVKDGDMIVMQAFKFLQTGKPSVSATEQSIVDGTVTVASAYMNVPGWVAIHTEVDGKPGPAIGYTLLPSGVSTDIKVEIDESRATPKLFAMLHMDAGVIGTYEFPGDDVPIKDGDMIVMSPFDIK